MGAVVGAGGGTGLGTDGSTVGAAPAEMGATEPSDRMGTATSPGAF